MRSQRRGEKSWSGELFEVQAQVKEESISERVWAEGHLASQKIFRKAADVHSLILPI